MIIERTVDSMDELSRILNDLPNNYIFRGHADAEWPLSSALERFLGIRWDALNAKKFENYSLENFRSKYHIYCGNEHVPQSKLAWLSVMQHYGIPTRLIDFTASPYIALYFALEAYIPQARKDLAIYALDYSALMESSIKFIQNRDSKFNETRTSMHGKQDEIFENVVDRYSYDIAWITEPDQLNARIDRQCGTFLISGNLESTIESIVTSEKYNQCKIHKIKIPGRLYENIHVALRKMNINSKVIYGDLAGLARSIKMELQPYTY
jgi:hypothetical protein